MIAIIIIIILCLLYAFVKNYKENFALINIKMKNIEEKISSLLIKKRTYKGLWKNNQGCHKNW